MKNLIKVETTTGRNGYPENIQSAFFAEEIKTLKESQKKHGGDLVVLHQKDGWQFWEKHDDFYQDSILDYFNIPDSEFFIKANDENAEEKAWEEVIGFDSLSEWLFECFPECKEFEKIEGLLRNAQAFIEEIVNQVDGETVIILDKENSTIKYSINQNSTGWSYDTHNYKIGLILPDDVE